MPLEEKKIGRRPLPLEGSQQGSQQPKGRLHVTTSREEGTHLPNPEGKQHLPNPEGKQHLPNLADKHLPNPEGKHLPNQAAAQPSGVAEIERDHVEPYIRAAGGQVLESHASSAAAWWAHTYAAPTPSGVSDCTHWCMPGIPDVWAANLLLKL